MYVLGTARVARDWTIASLGRGWTRSVGVLRSELLATPLSAWVHPMDVQALAVMEAVAEHRLVEAEVRMGPPLEWRSVWLALHPWDGGVAWLEMEPVHGPLPRWRWWKLSERADLPPPPPPAMRS